MSVGVREWAEIIGIMTDKETQGDEEVLIYAMTLINKVFTSYCIDIVIITCDLLTWSYRKIINISVGHTVT